MSVCEGSQLPSGVHCFNFIDRILCTADMPNMLLTRQTKISMSTTRSGLWIHFWTGENRKFLTRNRIFEDIPRITTVRTVFLLLCVFLLYQSGCLRRYAEQASFAPAMQFKASRRLKRLQVTEEKKALQRASGGFIWWLQPTGTTNRRWTSRICPQNLFACCHKSAGQKKYCLKKVRSTFGEPDS